VSKADPALPFRLMPINLFEFRADFSTKEKIE
jgi:hypothetical protein